MTVLIRIVLTGAVYAALGAGGLALAIPPGYASPLFPAAGMAVACALYFGTAVLPGVWLGSLAINLCVAWQNGRVDAAAVTVAVVVATGAMLQAWGARYLAGRLQGDRWRTLESEKDIALFLAIVAPLSCLVSASTGISVLYGTGVVETAGLFYAWLTWWVGDTLGVLTFAPLTLIVLLRRESPWKERLTLITTPMVLTLCLVVFMFLGVTHWERTQLNGRITEYGRKVAQLLDRRLVAHQEALSSLRRLIEVTPDMTYQQFEYFTRITLQDNKDIFALSFNPYILDRDRRAFERSMGNKTGIPFTITERDSAKKLVPAAVRPHYVSVGYIAPLEGNRPAVGFDINSEPIRRAAIEKARLSGHPAVTAPVQLVQENKKRVGVLVLHPAYREGLTEHKAPVFSLTGFAVGVIKVDEMVQIALGKELQSGIVFRLTDPSVDTGNELFFQSDGGKARPAKSFVWTSQLAMADRVWNLDVFPTAEFLRQQRSWLAWGIAIVGLFFTALLQVMLLAMTGRAAIIQRTVAEQTVELTRAKEELEQLNRSLQQRVDETVVELRRKDQVLISQGRQAAMGEMIGNIAHQWRQPINALAMVLGNIKAAYQYNDLTQEYLDKSVDSGNRLIQKMSTTINDFRNFFSPDKEKVDFSALQQIRHAVDLVEASFRNSNNISIVVDADGDCILNGFPNEFSQVLLNMLTNARDAIVGSAVAQGEVTISLREAAGAGVVTIRDNGGGIPEQILDKIFEPYFSTKNMGTGIGLYMSKMIIERNMGGAISVSTVDGGAEFRVSIPLGSEIRGVSILR